MYIRMDHTVQRDYYHSSLCRKGEIYTQDMAFHVYIRMGSTQRCDYYQQLVPQGEIYTQPHAYIRMGSTGAALRLLPAASRKGEWDMAFSMYISEWDLHGAALATTTSSLCCKGYRDMASPCISEWDLHGAAPTTTSSSHKGEIYTQGHGIPPCIYQNGIYTVQRCDYYQQLVPQGRMGHGIPPC
jgi:hypothetical protein